ncbi:conserved membrane hypothetical protein [Carnobacterium maltaromaticum]|uniref:hypothetical protein n=1 Tax=Carnobacterium maltaromaticum TaxID=2751 RepID=UPI00191BB0C3|nr:hypothetical protein [Carnobacterium maltaromaticum]CAD5900471.1 conserved membrane hypothetical protein [Carnobacterium maltaromaticum]
MILIFLAALLSSFGQFFWKFGANCEGTISFNYYIIGFFLAGLGMLLMALSFRDGPVSTLQPMMSIGFGFAFSVIIGNIFLHEAITRNKLFGVAFTIVGTILLSIERNEEIK